MGTPIRLISQAGNPGSQYDKAKHNAGFGLLTNWQGVTPASLLSEAFSVKSVNYKLAAPRYG